MAATIMAAPEMAEVTAASDCESRLNFMYELRTDWFPSEISARVYQLSKDFSSYIQIDNSTFPSANEKYTSNFCLGDDSCYVFDISDTCGDGLDGGLFVQGYVKGYLDDQLVFDIYSGYYGYSTTRIFCTGDIPGDSVTEDPLQVGNNWAYEMVNVYDVWDMGYTGNGVRVRVNDEGVDVNHPEFEGRVDVANSCPDTSISGQHGMKVAGILGATANNGHCAAGVAYDVTFSTCTIGNSFNENDLLYNLDSFDISQNSWLPIEGCVGGSESGLDEIRCQLVKVAETAGDQIEFCNVDMCTQGFADEDECKGAIFKYCDTNVADNELCQDFKDLRQTDCYFQWETDYNEAFERGAKEGRDGKGIIFVYAAGNHFESGGDVNMRLVTNSRHTISVGAVGRDYKHVDYSTPGAALTVSAPTGENYDDTHIMTANLGTNGCSDSDSGTSFAAPMVSGVIALMLQARPELTWRDVQGIIASTSSHENINDDGNSDPTAYINAAGFWHSNWYGFGIIDAKAAVEAAERWTLWKPEMEIRNSKDVNELLPTNGNLWSSNITIDASGYVNPKTEAVEVYLDFAHPNRGDLQFTLISPSGTESVLLPGYRPESNDIEILMLSTVRNWGEDPNGEWKLTAQDLKTDNTGLGLFRENEFDSWKLVIHFREEEEVPSEAPSEFPTEVSTAARTSINKSSWVMAMFVATFVLCQM